ncbi:glycoside hydrolase family 3 protein [bacterium]|nr:glycoside hydrolase family 3 protein [bacterium]
MTTFVTADIETLLATMTIAQKVGQILHPFIRPGQTLDEVDDYLGDIEPGGIFIMPGTKESFRTHSEHFQSNAKVPIVVSSDLECGPGRMIQDATVFPDMMAVAATGNEELAWTMGRAAALEGLEAGVHWNFAPVIDINKNPQNPITNTRSLGDEPELIGRLATAFIRGMQEHGMAGCAKHFPGDGYDARDQHICTTINPLSREDWERLSGGLYRRVIADGVWSLMIGHIALPCIDPGDGTSLSAAPPATLSKRLTTDLLRGELGFDGMIVSDASAMGGISSWGPREHIVPALLEAGCDQVLFCELDIDFPILMRAVEDGRLSMDRLDDAVRRVLAFKQKLGLFERTHGDQVSPADIERHRSASIEIAHNALTVAVDRHDALPMNLKPGSKVLSVHVRGDALYQVDAIDDMLREAGMEVTRHDESDGKALPWQSEFDLFDAILIHMIFGPSWNSNRIRPVGNYLRDIILHIPFHDRRVVFISYGTPYLLHDFPRLPALLNAYSPDVVTQRAVADYLQGKISAAGKSPVELDLREDWFARP